ncbi:MAG: molybdate ABC transporter permease subunit [Cytophagales bacterium]|nr:molybdate ABC transporter permease subunit [Armatimonadota bacterium]
MSPLTLSLLVATAAMLLAVPPGLVTAWWLGTGRPFPGKSLVETLLTLPLVLPPTVVGFGLLLVLGQQTALGRFLNDTLGVRLLLTWQAAAIASAIMAAPLFTRTAAAAFAAVDPDLLDAGRTLGASEGRLLFRVLIPLSYRGLLAGGTLAFARALGEFGATLMVAGTIPGRTQTLPLSLYAAVQNGKNEAALRDAVLLSLLAFALVGTISLYTGTVATRRGERP